MKSMESETKSEDKAIALLENRLLHFSRNVIYTSLEDIEETEWHWSPSEVVKFDTLWGEGIPIKEMATELRRTEIAVFLQALDRLYKEKIEPRNWRVW